MRSSTINSLIIWLCLLSFGIDFAAHSITFGALGAKGSQDAHHGYLVTGAADHHHEHDITHHSIPIDLSPADHLKHHNQPLRNDCPNERDHDETHHFSIQLRSSYQFSATLFPIESHNTQCVLYNAQAVPHLVSDPERSVVRDIIGPLRTIKLIV